MHFDRQWAPGRKAVGGPEDLSTCSWLGWPGPGRAGRGGSRKKKEEEGGTKREELSIPEELGPCFWEVEGSDRAGSGGRVRSGLQVSTGLAPPDWLWVPSRALQKGTPCAGSTLPAP